MNANLAQSQGKPVYYSTQNSSDDINGKNGWETPEKWQRIVLKRLVKKRTEEF